jgi:SMI1 / KNR4 family (SUKH-1)
MLDPKRFWAEAGEGSVAEPTTPLGQDQAMHMQLGLLLTGAGPPPSPEQLDALRESMLSQIPADAPEEMRRQAEEWVSQLATQRAQRAANPDPLGPAWPDGSAATPEQMAAWEKKYRVKLPKLFREVFRRQNGGMVRDSEVCINALASIKPVEEEDLYEDEFRDLRLVFDFAHDGGEGSYLLDYNRRGRDGEPAVYLAYRDCGEVDKAAGSVDKFFADLLKSEDGPEVDWSEADRLAVLARERMDLTDHFHGTPSSLDQVLCRDGRTLVLFVRRIVGQDETVSRIVLPEPLSTDSCSVEPIQPGAKIWQIHLQPRDSEGIVQIEATRTSAGRWKNRTSHGSPIYAWIWSADPNRLRKLRTELLGKDRAARVAEADDTQQQFQARVASLPPAAQRAAFMEMTRQAMAESERLFQEQNPDLGEPPPDIAALMSLMEGKMRDIQRRIQTEAAEHPLDPETRKLIERMQKMRRPDADD